MSVDLPEPEGPIIARYSFRLTSKETPCRACNSSTPIWYVFQMLCITMIESVMAGSDVSATFPFPFSSSINLYIFEEVGSRESGVKFLGLKTHDPRLTL